ncbi:MAG: PfkB family carbohydrate kinase [Negativicutes bacterium]|nr:PfkB family carbohydrate kinase [Negativicutes bacterium]
MANNLLQLIDNLNRRKIMVIGDMVADVYLEGKISRISREAPVLILEHQGETVVPGGAANVVHNGATLNGEIYAVGVVGDDQAGQQLVRVLADKKVITAGLIADPSRPTITKTRIMAGGLATVRQQVVRVDREAKEPLAAKTEQAMREYMAAAIPGMHGVVLSDYGSGTVSAAIAQEAISLCRAHGIPCMVDSRYNIKDYLGVTVVKQNEAEAAAALGWENMEDDRLCEAGEMLLARLKAEAVLITRGPEGMSLFEKSGQATHIPVTNKSEVYDVTGAGDTVVIAMIMAIAAGASYADAARLANFAAGIVVRKPGTATTNCKELKEAIGAYHENH